MLCGSFPNFNKRQWLTIVVIGVADFCNAICVSLQAPFYPKEAEAKGAKASEYGLVFGIFELVVFLVSPVYGHYLNRIGAKFMFNTGTFTVGVCAILFGMLGFVDDHVPFITFSFIIRIIEAMGNAAFLTASFTIIAKEFPNNVATTFASLETFFGVGLIVGPTVGGALYAVGGYTMPFVVMGFLLLMAAVLTLYVLPEHHNDYEVANEVALLNIVRIPGVTVATISIVVTSMSIGFLQATLEPHLRPFGLGPVVLGMMFVINGGTYAVTAPFFGIVCDKLAVPKLVTIFGCVMVMLGFSLIGPAPFLPMETKLWVSILGLVFHGTGVGAQLVASFIDALRTCVAHGFPNDVHTYGLVSGLWTSTFALGAFIGPSVAGVLYDTMGFRKGTMFVFGASAFTGAVAFLFVLCSRRRSSQLKFDAATAVAEESSLLASGRSDGGGHEGPGAPLANGVARSVARAVTIDRPPGMQGIIARNSYKNRQGTWHMKDSGAVLVGPYGTSASYGTIEHRGLLESAA